MTVIYHSLKRFRWAALTGLAGQKMQELIAASGASEDEIVAGFKKARRERRTRKGL